MRTGVIFASVIAGATFACPTHAIYSVEQAKPGISEEASAALPRVGQTLRAAEQLSFQANTIRVHAEANGEPLHIFHTIKVTVHRPHRLLGEIAGDDSSGGCNHRLDELTITSGLKPDDRVVVSNLWRATSGTKVTPKLTSIEAIAVGANQ